MEHHPTLAPSSWPALQLCAHFLSSGQTSEEAERGTRVHNATELLLNTGKGPNPIAIDEEEAAVWLTLKTKEILKPQSMVIGEQVTIEDTLTQEPLTFGTCDIYGRNKEDDMVTVIDWKTGSIDDGYKAQVKIYALAIMDKLGIDEVLCYILYGDHKKFSRFHVTKMAAERLFMDTLARQADPSEPYNANKHCSWCLIRPHCPAWTQPAGEALAVVGSDVDSAKDLDVIVKDPDKLARFIKGWKAISALVKDHKVTEKAIEFIEAGVPVGDYEVRERKGRKMYPRDSVYTMLQLVEAGLVKAEDASAMFILDPNEVDAYFKSKGKPVPFEPMIKGTYKILMEKNGR